ncbi:MAG: carbohydrate-binding domain-containing protein, partial [Solobacterium sp.]|nr:carbohydrate-binding domain-containing protein [Solobacterium sp.]
GKFTINASDDGINASAKSSAYKPTIEINGGTLDITMGAGDTDAIDSNGYIYINGGTINISAQSAFDFDYGAELNGGTVTVNGTQITSITNSMMGFGGGMHGGMMPGGNGEMPEGETPQGNPFGGRPQGPGGMQGGFGPGGKQ